MPSPFFKIYADALSWLEAEEQMDAIYAVAAGTGSLKKGAHEQYLAELNEKSKAGRPRPKAKRVSAMELESLPINIKRKEPVPA